MIRFILIILILFSVIYAAKGMSQKTYKTIEESTTLMEHKEYVKAKEVLDTQIEKTSSSHTYDLAFLNNALAYYFIQTNNYKKAIKSYQKALSYEALPQSMAINTLYTIAQLSLQIENYKQSITYLDNYHSENNITNSSAKLMMINYINLEQPKNALIWVDKTISLTKKADLSLLQNRLALELQLGLDVHAIKTLKTMITQFDVKKSYFKQLSYLYQKVGDEKKSVAILESAYQMGLLNQYDELMLLAQLLHYQGASIKAIEVLKAIKYNEGKEAERLEYLSRLQLISQETNNAIETLKQLYKLNNETKTALLISQLYADNANWIACETYAKKVQNEEGQLMLAICLTEQKKYPQAINIFTKLAQTTQYKSQAKMWLDSIEK